MHDSGRAFSTSDISREQDLTAKDPQSALLRVQSEPCTMSMHEHAVAVIQRIFALQLGFVQLNCPKICLELKTRS